MDSSSIVKKSAFRVVILKLTAIVLVCCLQHYRADSDFSIGVSVFNLSLSNVEPMEKAF